MTDFIRSAHLNSCKQPKQLIQLEKQNILLHSQKLTTQRMLPTKKYFDAEFYFFKKFHKSLKTYIADYLFSVIFSRIFFKIKAASSFPPRPKASPVASEIAEIAPIKIVFTKDFAIPS